MLQWILTGRAGLSLLTWLVVVIAGAGSAAADDARRIAGLRGQYFSDVKLEKLTYEQVVTRLDTAERFYFPDGRQERIGVRWTGELLVPRDGTYRFRVRGDDGVRMWLGGELVLEDAEMHGRTEEVPVELKAGATRFRLEMVNDGGSAVARVEWSGPKLKRQVIGRANLRTAPWRDMPLEALASVHEDEAGRTVERVPGLRGRYFEGVNFEKLALEQLDRRIHCLGAYPYADGRSEQVSVQWIGVIEIERAGDYTFYSTSDDGQRLWLDHELVIDDWNSHGMTEVRGRVRLDEGLHAIRIDHFQGSGPGGIKVEWQGPGVRRRLLDASVLRTRPWEGMRVPRPKVVFLAFGHSNMQGHAKKGLAKPHPRTWNWHAGEGRWQRVDSGDRGPTAPFMAELAEAHPQFQFGVIKIAHGGARLRENYRRGKRPYEELIGMARQVRASGNVIAGVITMQGWMEGVQYRDKKQCEQFADHYRAMVAEIREDLAEPDLPFLISQIEYGHSRKNRMDTWQKLHDSVVGLPKVIEFAAVVDSKDLPLVDDHHFNQEGNARWAKRALAAATELGVMTRVNQRLRQRSERVYAMASGEVLPAADESLVVEARVKRHSQARGIEDLGPYKDCLVVTEYEVLRVLKGKYESERLMTVQYAIRDRKLTEAHGLRKGMKHRLELQAWRTMPALHTIAMDDDIVDLSLPLYFARGVRELR